MRTYFSVPLHRMPAFASVPSAGGLRCTDDLAARALSLPMANDLSAREMDAIVASLAAAAESDRARVGRDTQRSRSLLELLGCVRGHALEDGEAERRHDDDDRRGDEEPRGRRRSPARR